MLIAGAVLAFWSLIFHTLYPEEPFFDSMIPSIFSWRRNSAEHSEVMSVPAKDWEIGEARTCRAGVKKYKRSIFSCYSLTPGDRFDPLTELRISKRFEVRWQGALPEEVRCTRRKDYFWCEKPRQ